MSSSSGSDEPSAGVCDPTSVAVIGLACRFPGDASNVENFWNLLRHAAYSKVPEQRFNVDGFYNHTKLKPCTLATDGGHFLRDNIAAWDANFFNISLNEAKSLDPQQRLSLEIAYEAFENAGIPLEKLSGSKTGCYFGAFTQDWREMLYRDADSIPTYGGSGSGNELISNRISWFYNLLGPSMTIETACSSSLVALHLACQSLRTKESKMAIVGGSSLILNPDMFIAVSNQNFLSRDGLCKSFDARADGYSRGEGFGAVILKPIDDAIRDKDPIRAVIRGTGVNQDGKTSGIHLPSADAQANLIRSTYQAAGLDLEDTNYFEAHGTGTRAGDRTELQAIGRVFGSSRKRANKLLVGSVKSNIGHLEAAAGVAAIIKSILCLEKSIIPPSIHFQNKNPEMLFDDWRVAIPTQLTSWPVPGLRRLSVNSFGYGGTNAHAILDDARHYLENRKVSQGHQREIAAFEVANSLRANGHDPPTKSTQSLKRPKFSMHSLDDQLQVFVFTMQDQDGLSRVTLDMSQYLKDKSSQLKTLQEANAYLRDLAFTLSEKRSRLPWKMSVAARSLAELSDRLAGTPSDTVFSRSTRQPKIAFVFTGQGAQWPQMGIELYRYSVFRETLEQADYYLTSLGCDWSVVEELARPKADSNMDLPAYSQTICTVLQIALVNLLNSWDISASAVIGHSSGEIAAAFYIGALSQEDAFKIAYYRGVLSSKMKLLSPSLIGGMIAVGASQQQAQTWISGITQGTIVLACVNSPTSVTISGDLKGIEELDIILKGEGVFARKLKVDTAYHSPHMHLVASLYLQAINDVQIQEPRGGTKMFSSVTGNLVDASELGPAFWVRNLLSPVLFSDALAELLDSYRDAEQAPQNAVRVLLEVGPHAALQGPIGQILKSKDSTAVEYQSLLRRGQSAIDTALNCAGTLFARGVDVNIMKVNDDNHSSHISMKTLSDLPPYCWNHSKVFWSEARMSREYRMRKHGPLSLLGAPRPTSDASERSWRGFLSVAAEPWLRDHQIQTSILYPAAGYIAMAIEGASEIADASRMIRNFKLRDIQIKTAIVMTEESSVECFLSLRPHLTGTRDGAGPWLDFNISTSIDGQDLRQNCCGLILVEHVSSTDNMGMDAERTFEDQVSRNLCKTFETSCETEEEPAKFYEDLRSLGLVYGPSFQNVTRIRSGKGESYCTVVVPESSDANFPRGSTRPHIVHPATLDAIFHTVFAALKDQAGNLMETLVPKTIDEIVVASNVSAAAGSRLNGGSHISKRGHRQVLADIHMMEESSGSLAIRVQGFCCVEFSSGVSADTNEVNTIVAKKMCSKLVWKPAIELMSSSQQKTYLDNAVSGVLPRESKQAVDELEMITLRLIDRALSQVDPQETTQSHLRDLYQTIKKQQSTGRSKLRRLDGGRIDKLPQDEADINSLLLQHCDNNVEAEALCQIGVNLPAILQGELEPEMLLAKKGLPQRLLGELRGMSMCRAKLAKYVELSIFAHPELAILELGFGNGKTASGILSSLSANLGGGPGSVDYTFAGFDATVLEAEKQALRSLAAFVKFKTLDLEQDLNFQDFGNVKYDIVVVSCLCETVHNVEKALNNVKRLLNSGGRLCLIEVSRPGVPLATVMRCLPKWSRSPAYRRTNAWQSRLEECGFNLEFTSDDLDDAEYQQTSLLIATYQTPVNNDDDVAYEDLVVLLEPNSPSPTHQSATSQMALELQQKSFKTERVLWGTEMPSLKGKRCVALMELEDPFLIRFNEQDFNTLRELISQGMDILWVSALDQPAGELVSGFARSIRNELAFTNFRILRVQPDTLTVPARLASLVGSVVAGGTTDDEFCEHDGLLQISRITENVSLNEELSNFLSQEKVELMTMAQADEPLKLCVRSPGMLDTICFETYHEGSDDLAHDEVEVEVRATGVNFRDVMISMGKIPDPFKGYEASGIVTGVGKSAKQFKIGDRVVALHHGVFRSSFRAKANICQHIPRGMSFEAAATLPVVHCTAFQALVRIARAQEGQTILIHAAAGGVGQAAIQLAKHLGMEIYATVGTSEKRRLIKELYGIKEDHIFNSRDLSFAKGVMRMTNGRGVDVILNSLSGEALRLTWTCIAPFGTFVEIGIKDILDNTGLDMRPFLLDTTFAFLNLEHIGTKAPGMMADIFEGAMAFIRAGVTKPVSPVTVYSISEVENAFRLMQTGKHTGKIALSFADDQIVPVMRNAADSMKLNPRATYVLVGGLGGVGRSLANLFVHHGAKNLCFLSRSGVVSDSARRLIKHLTDKKVHVRAYCCDIADPKALSGALRQCSLELPPIRGIVQCAMLLRDSLFADMTFQQWTESIQPKVSGSWNLHEQLLDVEFFIMLSSFAGIFGNKGQANYGAGGTYQDALAHYRVSKGLKAVTIDLGIMRDVGVLAEKAASADSLSTWTNAFGLRETEFHALMRKVITSQLANDHSLGPQIMTGLATGGLCKALGVDRPFYFDDARFAIMERLGASQLSSGAAADTSADGKALLRTQLGNATSFADAVRVVTNSIVAKVAKSLQTSPTEIDTGKALHTYGVDSLVANEIMNWIFKEIKAEITVFEILSAVPITTFAEGVARKSKLVPKGLLGETGE